MMTKKYNPLYFIKVCLCVIVFLLISHSFGVMNVQADESENRSVRDAFQSNDGQAPGNFDNEIIDEDQVVLSEEQNEASTDDLLPEQSLFSLFFQLFLALAVIIIMIYALIRFIGKRSQSYQSHRTLQNIGGVHLGTNRSIQLVRIADRVLVVGVGDSIQLLKEIESEDEVKKILEDYEIQEMEQSISHTFSWIKTKLGYDDQAKPNSNSYFKGILEKQLKDVKNSQQKAHAAIKEKETL